jgi:hypothetical protein
MRDMGEARGGIVISPRGRGTSTWYLGRGMVDVLEVWDDAMAGFAIDPDRVYVSGHSMGGWGSYLLSILMPDRFAAALPVAGPVTQGAWTGIDVPGCDEYRYDDYSPCYIATNDSDPRTQHTRRLLENLRNVPIGIYQGAIDELVPTSGVTGRSSGWPSWATSTATTCSRPTSTTPTPSSTSGPKGSATSTGSAATPTPSGSPTSGTCPSSAPCATGRASAAPPGSTGCASTAPTG